MWFRSRRRLCEVPLNTTAWAGGACLPRIEGGALTNQHHQGWSFCINTASVVYASVCFRGSRFRHVAMRVHHWSCLITSGKMSVGGMEVSSFVVTSGSRHCLVVVRLEVDMDYLWPVTWCARSRHLPYLFSHMMQKKLALPTCQLRLPDVAASQCNWSCWTAATGFQGQKSAFVVFGQSYNHRLTLGFGLVWLLFCCCLVLVLVCICCFWRVRLMTQYA